MVTNAKAKESGKEKSKNKQEGREEQVKKDTKRKNSEGNQNIVPERLVEQIFKESEGENM